MTDEKMEDEKPIDNGSEEEDKRAIGLNQDVLGMIYAASQFGTKEAPAVVESLYSRKIVGCPGGAGEEHDMVWFWLEKDKPYECAVCSQFFKETWDDIERLASRNDLYCGNY